MAPVAPATPVAPAPVSTPAPASAPVSAPAARPFEVRPVFDLSADKPKVEGKPAEAPEVIDFSELDSPKPKTQPTPKVAPKVEELKTEEPETPETQAEPETPFKVPDDPAPAAADPNRRDYSQLSPEDLAIAKKLPSKLFNQFTERLKHFNSTIQAKEKELAEAKAAANKYTHDHPEAYKLDPEFNGVLTEYNANTAELDFYNEQLVKAQSGEAWQYVDGYDANGQPIIKDVPSNGRVNAAHISQLQRAINQLTLKGQQIHTKAAAIRDQYVNSAAQVAEHYKTAETKLFPGLSPDKLKPEDKSIYDLVINSLPRSEQLRPSARMQALAAVVVMQVNRKYAAALAEIERLKRVEGTAAAASPIQPSPQAPAVAKSADVISWDEIDKLR